MPIVINHSRGPLEGYAALGYRKRQQEIEDAQLAQLQGSYGNAQQQMASIRGDLARLGAKKRANGEDQTDTYAGFAFNEPTTPTMSDQDKADLATAQGAYGQDKAARAEAENARLQDKLNKQTQDHELEKISLKEMAQKSIKSAAAQAKLDKEADDAASNVASLGAVADTFGPETGDDTGYTPREQRRLHELRDGLDKVRRDPNFSQKEKATAMKQMIDEINSIKPTEKIKKAFTYEKDADGNTWQTDANTGQRSVIDKAHPPKEEKPQFTNGDVMKMYHDAKKELTTTDADGNVTAPDDADVEKAVDLMMNRLSTRVPHKTPPQQMPQATPRGSLQNVQDGKLAPSGLSIYQQPVAPQEAPPVVADPTKQELADPVQQEKARQFIRDAKAQGMAPDQIRAEFIKLFGGS